MTRRWLAPDFFTDEKMKRATVPERLLAAAIIANQDDDGRLRGDPAYLRSIAFLYDDYPLDKVREMRDHLAKINPNIHVYQNDVDDYIQLKRYKRYQNPRYYHPSKFPVPAGWPFEGEPLKNEYKGDIEKTIQYDIGNKLRSGQWQPTGEKVTEIELNKRLGNLYADIVAKTPSGYILVEIKQYPLQFGDLGQVLGYRAEMETRGCTPVETFLIGNGLGNLDLKKAQVSLVTPLNLDLAPIVTPTSDEVTPTTPPVKSTTVTTGMNKGLNLNKSRGRGKGTKTSPSPVFSALLEGFPKAFGRKANSRELAYLRDIEKEISAAGATAEQVHDAYKEAASQNKLHLSYVRAILFDWLGLERGPPG